MCRKGVIFKPGCRNNALGAKITSAMLQNMGPLLSQKRSDLLRDTKGAGHSSAQLRLPAPPPMFWHINYDQRTKKSHWWASEWIFCQPPTPPPPLMCHLYVFCCHGVSDGSLRRRNRESRGSAPSYSRTVEDDTLLLFSLQPDAK